MPIAYTSLQPKTGVQSCYATMSPLRGCAGLQHPIQRLPAMGHQRKERQLDDGVIRGRDFIMVSLAQRHFCVSIYTSPRSPGAMRIVTTYLTAREGLSAFCCSAFKHRAALTH